MTITIDLSHFSRHAWSTSEGLHILYIFDLSGKSYRFPATIHGLSTTRSYLKNIILTSFIFTTSPPHSHHPSPPPHPPTLTSSQSRGLQLNVIPLALRWYSSSGGSTRITSNFDPREERSKVLRSHLRYIGCVAPLAIDSSYSEKHSPPQCKQKSS